MRTILISLITALGVALWSPAAAVAQTSSPTSLAIAGGIGLRGAGNIADCCGPFVTDVERLRSFWLSGSVSHDLTPRLAVDAEITWTREPPYTAYVEGVLGNAPVRSYAADDRVSTITTAGLVRSHAWRGKASVVDLVAGFGWAHERRRSHLRSIVFRPTYPAPPEYRFDIADARNTGAVIVGIDAETSGPLVAVFGQCRVHLQLSGDSGRSDLDLGRQVIRFGAGVRVRF